MHTVTLILTSGTPYTLNFNSEADARAAIKSSEGDEGDCELKDDWGISVAIRRSQIICRQVADVEKVMEGQGVNALIQARAQAKLNSLAAADPTLRFLQPQRPGIIHAKT